MTTKQNSIQSQLPTNYGSFYLTEQQLNFRGFYDNKTKLYPITIAHKLWFFTFNGSSTLKVLQQQNKNLSYPK